MAKTVLVVGGAGYIGSHSAYLLRQQGYQVIILDLFLHGQDNVLSDVTVIKGDFGDQQLLTGIFTRYVIDAVLHFAAFIEVGLSVLEPQKFYENNVLKSFVLFNTMLAHGVKKLIFSSSCAVYGAPLYVPMDEQHPKNPLSPYGKSKLVIEYMLQDYAIAYGLSSISLRYFNAAGAFASGGLVEIHKPETHLIPVVIQALLSQQPCMIFGNDYETSDGTCVRDYVHVSDIAQAHSMALTFLCDAQEVISEVVNVGTGKGHSVLQIIQSLERVSGKAITISIASRRNGDSPMLVAEATKITRLFAWQPQYTNLDDITESAYRAYNTYCLKKTC